MVAGTRLAVVMGTERRDRPAAPSRPLTVLEDSGDSVGGSTMLSTSVIPARPFIKDTMIYIPRGRPGTQVWLCPVVCGLSLYAYS